MAVCANRIGSKIDPGKEFYEEVYDSVATLVHVIVVWRQDQREYIGTLATVLMGSVVSANSLKAIHGKPFLAMQWV